jgi:hypothetical protein
LLRDLNEILSISREAIAGLMPRTTDYTLSGHLKSRAARQPARLNLRSAKHSVVGDLRQTDIEVVVVVDGGREVVFLIENKVGRNKQPTQSERYSTPRRAHRDQHCLLIARPQRRIAPAFPLQLSTARLRRQ